MTSFKAISEEVGKTAGFGNYPVSIIPNFYIKLSDGIRLSAKFWVPAADVSDTCFKDTKGTVVQYAPSDPAPFQPQPVVLEFLPYRKDDFTLPRDHQRHLWMSTHGYVCARVDMRGSGDSEGFYYDEYEAQEQRDAVEVIQWLSEQPWCNGNVGMYGKSWGGANGLQVAYHQPPALKSIITLYFVDDRYRTDIHYQGGCMLGAEMISWASQMFVWNARPPTPHFVPDWKQQWIERLEKSAAPWINIWMKHQTKDDYWTEASVSANPPKIDIPVLAIGGWCDGYRDGVFRLAQTLPNMRGIIGPWAHEWPDTSIPAPNINFMGLCLEWWDRHLKGTPNGAMETPLLRLYMQDALPPTPQTSHRQGHWVTDQAWPPLGTDRLVTFIPDNQSSKLKTSDIDVEYRLETVSEKVHFSGHCGIGYGEWLSMGGPDLPGDQRPDDSLSLCWTSDVLENDLSIMGNPKLKVTFCSGSDTGILVVRLCDVFPDNRSSLVTYGVLNLTHRDGHEPSKVKPLEKGKNYTVTVEMVSIGYRVPAGHRLRVGVSPSYWPTIWPAKDSCPITIITGSRETGVKNEMLSDSFFTSLSVPVHDGKGVECFHGSPKLGPPTCKEVRRPPSYSRKYETITSGTSHTVRLHDVLGTTYLPEVGTLVSEVATKTYSLEEHDPISARTQVDRITEYEWPNAEVDGVKVSIVTSSSVRCDTQNFYTSNHLEAKTGEEVVYKNTWNQEIPRYFV